MNELIQNLKAGNYHLSFSSLSAFMRSPRKFIEYKLKTRAPATDAIKRGYLFENLVLRDEVGGVRIGDAEVPYVIFDDTEKIKEIGGAKPRGTKVYKEWKEEVLRGVPEDAIVSADLVLEATKMRDRLWGHPFFRYKMKDDISETNVKVKWDVNGVEFIGVLDALGSVVYDIKSMVDCTQNKAYWLCRDRGYPMQVSMYAKASGRSEGFIVACDANLEVYISRISPFTVDQMNNRVAYYVDKFLECIDRDAWNQGQEFYTERGYYEWEDGII